LAAAIAFLSEILTGGWFGACFATAFLSEFLIGGWFSSHFVAAWLPRSHLAAIINLVFGIVANLSSNIVTVGWLAYIINERISAQKPFGRSCWWQLIIQCDRVGRFLFF
jgi:hypothetical protein